MPIDILKLNNCKGFKDVTLELKPLTLLLGPNSSGKSTLCKMLVALSKVHKRGGEPSLQFDDIDALDLGSYADLVHSEGSEAPVTIGIGVPSGYVEFGFGGGTGQENPSISQSSLTHINIFERDTSIIAKKEIIEGSTVEVNLPNNVNWDILKQVSGHETGNLYTRRSEDNWSGPTSQPYELSFAGLRLKSLITVSSDNKTYNAEYPRFRFNEISTMLSRTSYLRPDREAPHRVYYRHIENGKTAIGDRGEGTAWYLHENWDKTVCTYRYPTPTSILKDAKEQLLELSRRIPEEISLGDALVFWLRRLGLVSHIETSMPLDVKNNLSEAIKANLGVTLGARVKPNAPLKDLPDLGFGVSQALPVLVAGLMTPDAGLLIVDQPEAELHPLPQAELADFFCSMVKCGQSVLIETHSEEIFHRLRLRAEQDEDLARKIAVYFIDAPGVDNQGDFGCKIPKLIPLDEGAEFRWPDEFLSSGIEVEQQIRAARVAKEKEGR